MHEFGGRRKRLPSHHLPLFYHVLAQGTPHDTEHHIQVRQAQSVVLKRSQQWCYRTAVPYQVEGKHSLTTP